MMTFLSFCVFIHPGVVDYETTKDILYYLDNTHGIEGIASTSKTEYSIDRIICISNLL